MIKRFARTFSQFFATVMAEKSGTPEKHVKSGQKKDDDKEEEDKPSILDKFVEGLRGALPTSEEPSTEPKKVLDELSLEAVAKYIKDGKAKSIIVMTGAGVSTSAGIPDFRSPGSGLYHNLGKYKLPHPQAVFEISFFMQNPEPFFDVARELCPGKYKPTPGHYFQRLLHDKGLLLRTYTQNIDTLENKANIPREKVIEAHGSFVISHCLGCNKEYDLQFMEDIVFFGEALPKRFFTHAVQDFPKCDLLIIMGTSLVVQPFAGLVERVGPDVPRLLINDTKVGERGFMEKLLGLPGLDFDEESATRDVFWQGTCDNGCKELAKLLGWEEDLKKLIEKELAGLDAKGCYTPGDSATDKQSDPPKL